MSARFGFRTFLDIEEPIDAEVIVVKEHQVANEDLPTW